MFNITHTPKPGICKRRRCSHPIAEQGLCEKDLAEWRAAGSPPWSAQGTPISGASLIQAGTAEDLAEKKIQAEQVLDMLRNLPITDQASMDQAGKFLDGVRQARTEIKKQMDAALAPLKESVRQQEALYKPLDKVYAEAEALLRDKINTHIRMQEAAQDRARVAVEAAGGSVDEHTLMVAHGIENVALPVGMGVREAWTYELSDEAALRRGVALGVMLRVVTEHGQAGRMSEDDARQAFGYLGWLAGNTVAAPEDCLAVDTKRLAHYARTFKNETEIPGVKVSLQTTAVAARRGR